jgi:alanyl-tRNA synthetase
MTERLYYFDSQLREFEARILARKPIEREEGEIQQAVRLDRTAFYPTSGGQPYDTGTLDGKPVVDVWEDENGDIWHHVLEGFEDDAEVVLGSVDWPRRFDHMQQHSGQHLLSAVFETQLSAKTVGFHLSGEESTLDLDVSDLTWGSVFRVEERVNRIVWADHPVETRMIAQSELDAVDLRKPPTVTGTIRVIIMGPYDASACGGTHVARTGEIGLVKVVNFANYKGGSRVTFLCGGRALHHYQELLRLAETSSRHLSVGVPALPEAVDRLSDELKSTQRELREFKTAWSALKADQLWSESEVIDGVHVVIDQWADRDFDEIRATALRLRERSKTVALLAATGEGVRLICARSEDLPEINAVDVLHRALEPLEGRGGGSPALAQGGAAPHDAEAVLDAMRQSFSMGGQCI